jgi:hypothetical protein
MSKPITIQGLQTLLASHLAPCISLYLPTHRRLPQAKQDPVRFKNLMRTAESLLRSEYTNRDTKALLQPLESLRKVISGADKWAASHCFVPRTC